MEQQSTPLAPDVEYFIDAAVEHEEMDAGAALALKLYAPRRALMDIIDEEYKHDGPAHMRERIRKSDRLTAVADDILRHLPQPTAAPLAWAGVLHVRHWVRSNANMMAWWAQEDMIKGGCAEPYIEARSLGQARRMEDYITTPKQRRRLSSPAWIRRYVKLDSSTRRLRHMGDVVLARVRDIPLETVRDAATSIADMLESQHENYRRTNERVIRQTMMQRMPVERNQLRKMRKVSVRAAKTAESVLGADAVRRWVQGQPIRITGQTVAIDAARTGSSALIGHGGVLLSAVDPSTGRKLADMCLYHEKTPALDQVVAIALAIEAGEEADIIATANLSNLTDLGAKHPLIEGHASARRSAPWRPRNIVQERNEEYWTTHKDVYLEALGTAVLGRMWKDLQRMEHAAT